MKTQPQILTLTKEQKQDLIDHLKTYFDHELDVELGDLQADLFLEFLNTNVGKHFYNQGVTDTIQALREKAEDLQLLLKD